MSHSQKSEFADEFGAKDNEGRDGEGSSSAKQAGKRVVVMMTMGPDNASNMFQALVACLTSHNLFSPPTMCFHP